METRLSSKASVMAAVAVAAFAVTGTPVHTQQQQPPAGITPYQRDLTGELANKMKGTYVVAAVGDVLMQEPMGKMIDPALQKVLRDADTTVGNKEHYHFQPLVSAFMGTRMKGSSHKSNRSPKRRLRPLNEKLSRRLP